MRFALRPLARAAHPSLYARGLASTARLSFQIPSDVRALTEADKAAVAATAPVLAEHGVTITKEMYKVMLANNPQLKNIFSLPAQANESQPRALAGSVYGYAANIHDLSPLVPTVVRIAEKHAALGVKPEHYAVVAENLMGAISRVLGDAFTPQLQEAWYHAYWQLAKIFIDAEADLYAKGAWDGWKDFKITERTDETSQITSLEFVPTDPSMLPLKPYKPGQFITLRVMIDELGVYQCRHYSLSDAPSPDRYRITVKREDADGGSVPDGLVSTRLHKLPVGSTIQCSFPTGSFNLPSPLPEHIVFLSGGVGITPNMSMLNTIVEEGANTNISWIQGVQTENHHVFKQHVDTLVANSNGRIKSEAYYSDGPASGPNTHEGMIQVDKLDADLLALGDKKAIYYVCGPDPFMRDIVGGLKARGVDKDRIIVEAFRAGEVE
jgi:nitric oxide dioxygenase